MIKKIIIVFVAISLSILLFLTFNNKTKSIRLNDKYYNSDQLIEIDEKGFQKLEKKRESFILYVYEDCGCTSTIPFDNLVKKFIKEKNISMNMIEFKNIENLSISSKIRYSPTVVIFDKGKIVKYLKADSDKDLIYYQSYEEFENWIITKIKGN